MNKPWEPLEREVRIRSEYEDYQLCGPREEEDYFSLAAEIARREARRLKADKLIGFLKRPEAQ